MRRSRAECHTASWDEHDVAGTTRVRVPLTRPVVTARYADNTPLASITSPTPCRGPGGSCYRPGGISTRTTRCGILELYNPCDGTTRRRDTPMRAQTPMRVHVITGGFPPGSPAGHDMDYARLRLLELVYEHPHVHATVANDYTDIARWLPESHLLITYVAGPYPNDAQHAVLRQWLAE